MAVVKVKIKPGAVPKLLRSAEVLADLERRGQAIARVAGPGMECDTYVGANRARATVRTATGEARRAEARSRSLTSAIDAGR